MADVDAIAQVELKCGLCLAFTATVHVFVAEELQKATPMLNGLMSDHAETVHGIYPTAQTRIT